MAAVANGTGLTPPEEGLTFPPVSTDELPKKLRPMDVGGVLSSNGTVEVISSLNRDGSKIANDLRWGVYVTFKAQTKYAAQCFEEYGIITDQSGMYASLYRPYHMIGMELGISVASAVLRREATGAPLAFAGDVISVAKKNLESGEVLDGEGGYCVTGSLAPAKKSLSEGALPIGLASRVKLKHPVAAGNIVKWDDVEQPEDSTALRLRKEMEAIGNVGGISVSNNA